MHTQRSPAETAHVDYLSQTEICLNISLTQFQFGNPKVRIQIFILDLQDSPYIPFWAAIHTKLIWGYPLHLTSSPPHPPTMGLPYQEFEIVLFLHRSLLMGSCFYEVTLDSEKKKTARPTFVATGLDNLAYLPLHHKSRSG